MKQYLKQFATSRWFDLIGVALVVGIAISAGYLNSRLEKFVVWGPWTALVPFGLISYQCWYFHVVYTIYWPIEQMG